MSSLFREIQCRENGGYITDRRKYSNIYSAAKASNYLIERLKRGHILKGHHGCINSALFTDDGQHILTGSDDTYVNLYSVDDGKMIARIKTIHTNNIFFAKDLPGSQASKIVTCAADGRVVLMTMDEGRDSILESELLHRHVGRAHRVGLIPQAESQFYTCGEDGYAHFFDLRAPVSNSSIPDGRATTSRSIMKTKFKSLDGKGKSIYAVCVNPQKPNEVALSGTCPYVGVYDSRKFDEAFAYYSPDHLRSASVHVTGLKYDSYGEHILASYNDEDIYLMNVIQHAHNSTSESQRTSSTVALADSINSDGETCSSDVIGNSESYSNRYTGHRNDATVKQVSFFGDKSEWVVSGSDCGHIFIWNTKTANVVKLLKGDAVGAVNCLSQHPVLPLLVTSGLSHTAKMWAPTGEHLPLIEGSKQYEEWKKVKTRNMRSERDELDSDELESDELDSDEDTEINARRRRQPSVLLNFYARQLGVSRFQLLSILRGLYSERERLSGMEDEDEDEDEDDDEDEDESEDDENDDYGEVEEGEEDEDDDDEYYYEMHEDEDDEQDEDVEDDEDEEEKVDVESLEQLDSSVSESDDDVRSACDDDVDAGCDNAEQGNSEPERTEDTERVEMDEATRTTTMGMCSEESIISADITGVTLESSIDTEDCNVGLQREEEAQVPSPPSSHLDRKRGRDVSDDSDCIHGP